MFSPKSVRASAFLLLTRTPRTAHGAPHRDRCGTVRDSRSTINGTSNATQRPQCLRRAAQKHGVFALYWGARALDAARGAAA
eukprot:5156774-Pleurochrysis_carterae.AAC.1